MKKRLLMIAVTLILVFGSAVTVYAGPLGGQPPPPPIPTSIGICLTMLPPDCCATYDDSKCDDPLLYDSKTYNP